MEHEGPNSAGGFGIELLDQLAPILQARFEHLTVFDLRNIQQVLMGTNEGILQLLRFNQLLPKKKKEKKDQNEKEYKWELGHKPGGVP